MSDFSLDDPSFYEDFLVEAGEHFELIEQNFLTLEGAPGDLEILNGIFRSVHTIKGASGFLGLTKVQALAHIGENVLDDLRKGRMAVSPAVMELLFETEDVLKVLVNDVGVGLRKQGAPVPLARFFPCFFHGAHDNRQPVDIRINYKTHISFFLFDEP